MKKRWIFAALVAIFALAMFGCKNEPDDPTPPPKPVAVTGVTINAPTTGTFAVGTDTYVEASSNVQFSVTIAPSNATNKSVTWEVTGGSGDSTISASGLLAVDADEDDDEELTIKATSKADATKSDTFTVKVAPASAKIIQLVVVNTSPTTGATKVILGQTQQFSATVTGRNIAITGADQAVSWSITGETSNSTTINNAGLLSVGSDEEPGRLLTVTATSTASVFAGSGAIGSYNIYAAGTPVDPDTEQPPATAVDEYVALENGSYAVYKFTIPDGRSFQDYVSISAEYKIVYPAVTFTTGATPEWTGAQIRGGRLMGNYKAGLITDSPAGDFQYTNGGKALNAYVAQFDGGNKNAPYIFYNGSSWTSDYSIFGLDKDDPTDWFTRILSLTESDYTGRDPANWPGPDYEGDLLLAIGISGAGDHIVQQIKNVKLLASDDMNALGVGSLYSTGGVVEMGQGDKPVFASSAPYPDYASPYRGATQPTIVKFNVQGNGSAQRAIAVAQGSTFANAEALGLILDVEDFGPYSFSKWTEAAADTSPEVDSTFAFTGDSVTLYAQWDFDSTWEAPTPEIAHPGVAGAATELVFDVSDPTWDNAANQKGWNSTGTTSGDYPVNAFVWAQFLVINMSQMPKGLEVVWKGQIDADHDFGGWNSASFVGWYNGQSDTDAEAAILALNVDGVTITKETDNSFTVTIETRVFRDYLMKYRLCEGSISLLFQTNNWAASVNSAKLVIPAEADWLTWDHY